MSFKLFYKSNGGQSTTNTKSEYNYPVAELHVDNFEDLGREATEIIHGLGIGMGDFGIDVLHHGQDYDKNVTNGTGKQQDSFTNHTGEY